VNERERRKRSRFCFLVDTKSAPRHDDCSSGPRDLYRNRRSAMLIALCALVGWSCRRLFRLRVARSLPESRTPASGIPHHARRRRSLDLR